MIISASRRTDLPAFYSEWFINRVRAGYCAVPNPFNTNQVSRVSLLPPDVDCFGFWTRNPRPLMRYLGELDAQGYCYYFHQTIVNYPRPIDPHAPAVDAAVRTFRELADRIGPARVMWRYDPMVFSTVTGPDFHRESFARIARELRGHTGRCIISILDLYRKVQRRLGALAKQGILFYQPGDELGDLVRALVGTAGENGIEVLSCAEPIDLRPYGVRPGACIDGQYIARQFNLNISAARDPGQRETCGCTQSRDVGMYNSCLFGCQYCYATGNFSQSRLNYAAHDPRSPSLLGWHDAPAPETESAQLPLI